MEMPDSNLVLPSPVVEAPYVLGTSTPGGVVIPAGARNVPLLLSDFSLSLEWPLKVPHVRFVNDAQHTFRDWGVRVVDQTFNMEWMKNPVMVEGLINVQTGYWELGSPWIIRSQGGGQNWFVDNYDNVNPITIAIYLDGLLQIPARGR